MTGSGINILYASTMKSMNIPMTKLHTSHLEFHEIIPGKKAHLMGMITLTVVFDTPSNFRKEKITFEVVDFSSAYHALLGWPAYARFMTIPCYVYLKLKMPGPRGVTIISGDYKQAKELLQKGSLIWSTDSRGRVSRVQEDDWSFRVTPTKENVIIQVGRGNKKDSDSPYWWE